MSAPSAENDAPRLVRQEHAWGCGVAALAMVTRQTYDEVHTWILDHWTRAVMGQETAPANWLADHGVTQYALDWYLGEHGYAWRRIYRAWSSGSWPPEPFAPVHVVQVVQPSGMAHFVVLTTDGRVLDPMSDTPRSLADWEQINHVQGIWPIAGRPTFAELLNDPTQQLDTEGVVLQSVTDEQERDRLRAEGWRACVDHIWHTWKGWLYGEDLYHVGRNNPFATRPIPSDEERDAAENDVDGETA